MASTQPSFQLPAHGETLDIGGKQTTKKIAYNTVAAITSGKPPPKSAVYIGGAIGWAAISTKKEFYQTGDELENLKEHFPEIWLLIYDRDFICEVGPGDFQKTRWLLLEIFQKLEEASKRERPFIYFNLDISSSLADGVTKLSKEFPSDRLCITGLSGSIDDGLRYFKHLPQGRLGLFLSLGSLVGNEAASDSNNSLELQQWTEPLDRGHRLIFGLDSHDLTDVKKIMAAYGTDFVDFVFSELRDVVWKESKQDILNPDDWEADCVLKQHPNLYHCIILIAKRDLDLGHQYKAGDELEVFKSHKHPPEKVNEMCKEAGLAVAQTLRTYGSKMTLYIAESPKIKPSVVPT